MQLPVNKEKASGDHAGHPITILRRGESGILDRIELPEPDARRLMEMGFLPGHVIVPARWRPAAIRASIAWTVPKLPCAAKPPVT
jgi:Fe2+ transport system protein FeoA